MGKLSLNSGWADSAVCRSDLLRGGVPGGTWKARAARGSTSSRRKLIPGVMAKRLAMKLLRAAFQITLSILYGVNSFCDAWSGEELCNSGFSLILHQWLYRNNLQRGDVDFSLHNPVFRIKFSNLRSERVHRPSLTICACKAIHFYLPLLEETPAFKCPDLIVLD